MEQKYDYSHIKEVCDLIKLERSKYISLWNVISTKASADRLMELEDLLAQKEIITSLETLKDRLNLLLSWDWFSLEINCPSCSVANYLLIAELDTNPYIFTCQNCGRTNEMAIDSEQLNESTKRLTNAIFELLLKGINTQDVIEELKLNPPTLRIQEI